MKRKRSMVTVKLALLLVLLLGVTGFAAEIPEETDVTDETEETAKDMKTATVYVEKIVEANHQNEADHPVKDGPPLLHRCSHNR